MHFSKRNTLIGWLVFAISLFVYTLTLEPTMSLWDCGEFLVSAYKLEINHSPGSPLFMLLGRIFSLFSFGNPQHVAFAVNMISAISSAATVLFLFWIISWLISKFPAREKYPDWLVLFASATGSLAYAFTDSSWFSAVEAEVYALSSLFFAAILWVATKWEREAEGWQSNRWIVLIFFLIGLSIGVHLLNLLVIPTVALIWYFRKYSYSVKGLIATLIVSGVGIIFLMKIFIPGIFDLSKGLELFCVNTIHFPVNSGLLIYVVLIITLIGVGLYMSVKRHLQQLNLALLCVLFLLIGYSSYFATLIRSAANPPVDQGNPETTFDLLYYLNREQYGSRPVLYGPNCGSVVNGITNRYTYKYLDGKYIRSELNPDVSYDANTTGFFPRIYSNDPGHEEAYQRWVNFRGRKVSAHNYNGEKVEATIPTFEENLSFFMNYQLGHMFFRYFMWNFVGRQNDIQGLGELTNGNWQSGIPFIDALHNGSQQDLPDEMKNNKARNSYYFLPLLLGLLGLFFHYKKDMHHFFGILLLFMIMSVGLVIYLNEIPITPRERDYVFVGAFFAFCIWVGMGVLALFDTLKKWTGSKPAMAMAAIMGILAGPLILISQNYNDHDRSGRYTGRDFAKNYLESCAPNAILFTHADNDTYPLWYCQEVEGIRRDVRVVVMPYLNAGWYIEQLQRKIYDNGGLQFAVPSRKYQTGDIDYLYVVPKVKTEQPLSDVLNFIARKKTDHFFPVNQISIKAPNGDSLHVQMKKRALTKGELAVLDIVDNNWKERPVYFTAYSDAEDLGLGNYMRFDGLVFRLQSNIYSSDDLLEKGEIAPTACWNNLMEKCDWSNLEDSSIYFDWHHRRMLASMQVRNGFYRLAKAMLEEEKPQQALQALGKSEKCVPYMHWAVDYPAVKMAALYFRAGDEDKGRKYTLQLTDNFKQWLNYYSQMNAYEFSRCQSDFRYKLYLYQQLIVDMDGIAPADLVRQMQSDWKAYLPLLENNS